MHSRNEIEKYWQEFWYKSKDKDVFRFKAFRLIKYSLLKINLYESRYLEDFLNVKE